MYCWGFNGDGQLGTNDQSDHQSPVLVMSLENPPVAVAAGSAHSVVLAGEECQVCLEMYSER